MDKTMGDKLIYIHNDCIINYQFCRLQLVFETFEHSTESNQSKFMKIPKVVKPTNKKTSL